jgi:hypothetical protein
VELKLVEAALNVIQFPDGMTNYLGIGAERFLSTSQFRRVGDDYLRVCDDPEQFSRAARLIIENKRLLRGRIVEYGLELVARLPQTSDELVRVVADTAFNEHRQDGEVTPRDMRPLARATLAKLGAPARLYADRAFAEITISDAMGTTAAQVAVAGGHTQALGATEKLMADALAKIPKGSVVPWAMRNRLYELAQALAYGGAEAKSYAGPLLDLMSREVQSWAPPFGMVELPPSRMCPIASEILEMPIKDLGFVYCLAEPLVLEQ